MASRPGQKCAAFCGRCGRCGTKMRLDAAGAPDFRRLSAAGCAWFSGASGA